MKKHVLLLLFIVSLLQIPVVCNAWPKPEKVKKSIIGTWKFFDFYYAYDEYGATTTTDPQILYKAYTFQDNGKCIIWSLDKSKLDFPTQTVSWALITKKDKGGEEFTGVVFAESNIDPKDIEKTLYGVAYFVTASNNKMLAWVKADRIDITWKKEAYTRFMRIPDLPHD